MPQMPTCPKCGQPIEGYTETLAKVTIRTSMTWDFDEEYPDEAGYSRNWEEQEGGSVSWSCDACGAELDECPEPIEEAAP